MSSMSRNGSRYRSYSPTAIAKAYRAIKEDGQSVCGAARMFGLPETTLRDRVKGKVGLEVTKSGQMPTFTTDEEARLVEHCKMLSSYGYDYTRKEITECASIYAVSLNKRDRRHPFSLKWYRQFARRWPGFRMKSRKNKAAAREAVSSYYLRLEKITSEHGLTNEPELIYSIDEKSVKLDSSFGEATSEAEATVTIIGCGSALGQHIPPYFVFPGQRMRQELLRGATPGANGTVGESGWSTSDIYIDYLAHHFLKYARERASSKTLLLLYDGHSFPLSSIPVIDWAREHNILMVVSPAHFSYIDKGLELSCFGPFESLYNTECHEYMEKYSCTGITKHSVCEIACKTYLEALSQDNLQSAFEKSRIFPLVSVMDKPVIPNGPLPPKPRTVIKRAKPRATTRRKKSVPKKRKLRNSSKTRARTSPKPGPPENLTRSPPPSPENLSDDSSSSSSSISSSSSSSESGDSDFED